jgi:hypothetical protein
LGEFSIDIIYANTAAAKGRVERANLMLQDPTGEGAPTARYQHR